MHPLEKIDAELNLPVGLTRSVIALHNTENVPVLRSALVKFGIRVNDDTSIPKEDRVMWRAFAQACELPPEWWMDDGIVGKEEIPELPAL